MNGPTSEQVLKKYPRLTAHLICESLGYFTPQSAANAIQAHIQERGFACEWYIHLSGEGRTLKEAGANTLARAFHNRHNHQGYMAHYPRARAMVEMEASQPGASGITFSSWQ